MNYIFVLDTDKKPLTPCHPARARSLLSKGKASVYRRVPFTIILKSAIPEAVVKPVTVKIDPGSKTSGLVLTQECRVIFSAELTHRGAAISERLTARRTFRRHRRNRKTRYRAPRFLNRVKPKGWLPPSLMHRIQTTLSLVSRFRQMAFVGGLAVERVKFDLQKLQNPEISKIEYQRGVLFGFEVKEYLLAKWGHKCSYCSEENVPLEVEHLTPLSKGGTNRVSNLVLACRGCNLKKNNLMVDEFLKNKPELLNRIKAQAKASMRDAAAVNATRNRIFLELLNTGLPVESGTGGQTKFNRVQQGYPKAHWVDAACVGESGRSVKLDPAAHPLLIKCTGRGNRHVVSTDKFGFPRAKAGRVKRINGFQTGDLVRLDQPKGKYAGIHIGRLSSIRANGRFSISTMHSKITSPFKNFKLLQRGDGYAYT